MGLRSLWLTRLLRGPRQSRASGEALQVIPVVCLKWLSQVGAASSSAPQWPVGAANLCSDIPASAPCGARTTEPTLAHADQQHGLSAG